MREKHTGDRAERNAELIQPLHRATPGVENEFLGADFHQRARSAAVPPRRRRAGAEQSDAKKLITDPDIAIPLTETEFD